VLPVKALKQRVARVHAKVTKIAKEAASKTQTLKNNNHTSWNESFDTHVGELMRCISQIATTPQGGKDIPDVAKQEGKRMMLEQVGRGSCKMLQEEIGRGPKSSITKFMTEFVTDISMFSEHVGCSKKYTQKARRGVTISKCLRLNYSLQGSYTHYQKHQKAPQEELHKVIECFFLRKSNVRSGARDAVRTSFRELPMKLVDFEAEWFAEFPSYCSEAAKAWPAWYDAVQCKRERSTWEASVVASVSATPTGGADGVAAEVVKRRIESQVQYHLYLRKKRFRLREASLCNAKERAELFEKKRRDFEEQELNKLKHLDVDVSHVDLDTAEASTIDWVDSEAPIKPPSLKFVFKIIKKLGYTWSQNVYPTECPIYDNGPLLQTNLKAAQEAVATSHALWMKKQGLLTDRPDNVPAAPELSAAEKQTRLDYAKCLKELRALEA